MSTRLTEARQKAIDARKQIEAAQEEMAESIKTVLTDGFAALFDEYQFLGSIAWSQYTPYFNDGDPCVFQSQFTYPSLNSVVDVEDGTGHHHGDENGEDFDRRSKEEVYTGYADGRSTYESNTTYDPDYARCEEDVYVFVKSVAGDEPRRGNYDEPSTFDAALLRAFGDHAEIVATRDGIEVDTCSHD